MTTSFHYPTEYFVEEGKENLDRCLAVSFEAALSHEIEKIVIFTGAGVGVQMALEEYRSQDRYSHLKLVAVTFPHGSKFADERLPEHRISAESAQYFKANGVPIVMAHLPFNPIRAHNASHGILGQDLSLIGNALSIFCGSMSLCVQAALMACDAGEVEMGEHVIVLTSDTSILVRASGTRDLLTDFIVREILCKPVLLTIIKREKIEAAPDHDMLEADALMDNTDIDADA